MSSSSTPASAPAAALSSARAQAMKKAGVADKAPKSGKAKSKPSKDKAPEASEEECASTQEVLEAIGQVEPSGSAAAAAGFPLSEEEFKATVKRAKDTAKRAREAPRFCVDYVLTPALKRARAECDALEDVEKRAASVEPEQRTSQMKLLLKAVGGARAAAKALEPESDGEEEAAHAKDE